MPKKFLIYAAIVLVILAAFAWLTPRSADASGFESPALGVDAADEDFCFGPGNQGVGIPCNSNCSSVGDPEQSWMVLPCPGPPAAMSFEAAPGSVSCGSQSTLSVTVIDAKGIAVANDTLITFMTDGGVVGEDGATLGGLATVTFRVAPKTSGVAHVVARVNNIRADKTINIGC